jgi:hypothetical protein
MRAHRWAGKPGAHVVAGGHRRRRFGVRQLTDGQSGYRALSAAAAVDAEVVLRHSNVRPGAHLDLLAKGHRYREVPIS